MLSRARYHSFLSLIVLFFAVACATDAPKQPSDTESNLDVPAWAKDVVWYQIFVERFRNGDPSNDPTLHDIEGSWPHMKPDGWESTPWGQDWYRQEPWAEATGEEFYRAVKSHLAEGGIFAQWVPVLGSMRGQLSRISEPTTASGSSAPRNTMRSGPNVSALCPRNAAAAAAPSCG